MNDLLQKHGCANVFTIPDGLKELMSDISREVLRDQPAKIYNFIANYLSVLLITREHGILALRVLDDLCDCRPSVMEHLSEIGLTSDQAAIIADIIKDEVEGFEPVEGKETVKESQIVKRILIQVPLDEVRTAKVCQVARNAYREYWYRKKVLEKSLKVSPDEPWEIAAERTLMIYKSTKPSFTELTRATEKIQAAYRGYHVRRNILRHLKPKKKKKRGPKVNLLGPPLDIAASREIDLGPLIDIKVHEDDMSTMFGDHETEKLGLPYDPQTALTHIEEGEADGGARSRAASHVAELKSLKSLLSPMPVPESEMMMEHRRSRTPSAAAPDVRRPSRQSHVPTPAMTPRQSRLPSQAGQVISFSEVPDEIPDESEAKSSAPDEGEENEMSTEAEDKTVTPETFEVAEDITDDRTEADGESAPTASVPTSAPETDATDVEDVAEDMATSEEEG